MFQGFSIFYHQEEHVFIEQHHATDDTIQEVNVNAQAFPRDRRTSLPSLVYRTSETGTVPDPRVSFLTGV